MRHSWRADQTCPGRGQIILGAGGNAPQACPALNAAENEERVRSSAMSGTSL